MTQQDPVFGEPNAGHVAGLQILLSGRQPHRSAGLPYLVRLRQRIVTVSGGLCGIPWIDVHLFLLAKWLLASISLQRQLSTGRKGCCLF
ncbi:hypothetical protein [Bradyrhizobium sp. WSM1743]|uniref:hypothetical protein n=1 Tax=Bradyrhizobium sp. WSM1743 TaxID=318996 RepID=UPI0012EB5557|nr:hypothetical protein [Bradyrhizobium sp. WSM1743]